MRLCKEEKVEEDVISVIVTSSVALCAVLSSRESVISVSASLSRAAKDTGPAVMLAGVGKGLGEVLVALCGARSSSLFIFATKRFS